MKSLHPNALFSRPCVINRDALSTRYAHIHDTKCKMTKSSSESALLRLGRDYVPVLRRRLFVNATLYVLVCFSLLRNVILRACCFPDRCK